ncbi:MAG: hypothetical protein SFU56_06000 [Capsulimonadales bacterium]|nr:hypothetical protein [Capsulimonadales bacterium]
MLPPWLLSGNDFRFPGRLLFVLVSYEPGDRFLIGKFVFSCLQFGFFSLQSENSGRDHLHKIRDLIALLDAVNHGLSDPVNKVVAVIK